MRAWAQCAIRHWADADVNCLHLTRNLFALLSLHPMCVSLCLAALPSPRPLLQNPSETSQNLTGYQSTAMEMLTACRIAIDSINSDSFAGFGVEILSGYTLELDVRNTYYNGIQAAAATTALLDASHNTAPPPVVIGMVGYDEASSVASAAQPFQTPLITHFISTSSLTNTYPNFNRYCSTDMIEAFALLSIINTFSWKNIAIIYNNDGSSSTQLMQAISNFAPAMAPGLNIDTYGYTYDNFAGGDFPDLSTQLTQLQTSGVRIILLSGFAPDIPFLMIQLNAFGLFGAPYSYLGSNQWCFDETIHSGDNGLWLNGLLCVSNYYNTCKEHRHTQKTVHT